MLHFLSPEALYGLLLVTTFVSVGLLGLWAATSRWHPFLRTTIVLAILSVLLLRPMYEPFVMLISQVATIAAGVAVYRWFKKRKQSAADAKPTRYQFSLKTLLFVSTLTALAAAIGAKAPELGWKLWVICLANGVVAGLGTLCAAKSVASNFKMWIRVAYGAGAVLFFGIAIPPSLRSFEAYVNPFQILPQTGVLAIIGFAVVTLLSQVAVILASRTTELHIDQTPRQRLAQPTRPIALLTLALLLFLPSYYTWKLLNPPQRPPLNTMKPNAYSDLDALGKKLDNSSLIVAVVADPIDYKKLSQEVSQYAADYRNLENCLDRGSIIPDPLNSWQDSLTFRRTLARVLDGRRELQVHEGDIRGALHSSIQTVRLAEAYRGGLLVDFLVSIAIEGIGMHGMYPLVEHLNAEDCQTAIDALIAHEQHREPFGEVTHREFLWSVHHDGWWGHVCGAMNEHRNDAPTVASKSALDRSRALAHLLLLELAFRKYQLTHNSLPDSLDQLVPDILPEVPRDPFDSAEGVMRYKKTADGYILYSVGQNGVDNGAVPPASIQNSPHDLENWWQDGHGDLRLDHYFAE